MIVAKIELTTHGLSGICVHTIRFNSLIGATAEYERVAGLINKRSDRGNDLPTMVEVVGSANRVSVHLASIHSVGLQDFVRANDEEAGMQEAYPNLSTRT